MWFGNFGRTVRIYTKNEMVHEYPFEFGLCRFRANDALSGECIDDSVIMTIVKSLLADDDFLKSFQISVEICKGTVQVSGFVNSQSAIDKAVEIAHSESTVFQN